MKYKETTCFINLKQQRRKKGELYNSRNLVRNFGQRTEKNLEIYSIKSGCFVCKITILNFLGALSTAKFLLMQPTFNVNYQS